MRKLLATENAARRLADERHRIANRAGNRAARRRSPRGCRPMPCIRASMLEADPLPAPADRGACRRTASCWCSTRSPIRTMSAPSSARPRRSRPRAIVTTARHSPEATGVLAKAASGALEHVPLVDGAEPRARRSPRSRRAAFSWSASTATATPISPALPLRAPLALVLGAEGKGLRQLTKRDLRSRRAPRPAGRIKSLNVSNAAALGLYVANRRPAGWLKTKRRAPKPAVRSH